MTVRRGDQVPTANRSAFETCDEFDPGELVDKRQTPDSSRKLATVSAVADLMLYGRDLSGAHCPKDRPKAGKRPGRGGARNRADRVSTEIPPARVEILLRAAEAAIRIGLPLNRHVTIHWERLGVPDAHGARATGGFLRLFRDWLRQRRLKTAWVWVRENGQGKGSHVHIALHVPPHAPWTFSRLKAWLERIADAPYVVRSIRTTRIAGRADAAWRAPERYAHNLSGLLAYMTKQRGNQCGLIIGKRSGHSQNLGQTMRADRR